MFRILNTIETTLKKQHFILILTIISSFLSICSLSIFFLAKTISSKQVVYVVDNQGSAIALREVNEDPIAEAKGQFRDFHYLFFNIPPDGAQIKKNIELALNLCDESGKVYFDTFKEQHFYNKLIATNTTQSIEIDSISINNRHPYQVELYAKVTQTRASMVVQKQLITSAQLRRTVRSINVPHGFIIEKFRIIQLKDVKIYQKQ